MLEKAKHMASETERNNQKMKEEREEIKEERDMFRK